MQLQIAEDKTTRRKILDSQTCVYPAKLQREKDRFKCRLIGLVKGREERRNGDGFVRVIQEEKGEAV